MQRCYTGCMLQLSDTFIGIPILSLRTGVPVAVTTQALINPNNLKFEGFFCNDTQNGDTLILLTQDIRERLPQGYVINDHEVLALPDELIRLKKIISTAFQLINKPVETMSGDKVGKVHDYAVNEDSFYVQKLYLTQPLVKSFTGGRLVVDRNQINEITNKKIIIDDLLNTAELGVPARS